MLLVVVGNVRIYIKYIFISILFNTSQVGGKLGGLFGVRSKFIKVINRKSYIESYRLFYIGEVGERGGGVLCGGEWGSYSPQIPLQKYCD